MLTDRHFGTVFGTGQAGVPECIVFETLENAAIRRRAANVATGSINLYEQGKAARLTSTDQRMSTLGKLSAKPPRAKRVNFSGIAAKSSRRVNAHAWPKTSSVAVSGPKAKLKEHQGHLWARFLNVINQAQPVSSAQTRPPCFFGVSDYSCN